MSFFVQQYKLFLLYVEVNATVNELLTMGNVNMVYRNLKADKIRKRISYYFVLQPIVLESWITSLTLLRNAYSHHSRVWNKVSSVMPVFSRRIAHSTNRPTSYTLG